MVHRTKWIGKLGTTFDPPKNKCAHEIDSQYGAFHELQWLFTDKKFFATNSKQFLNEMSIYHLIFSFLFRQDEVLRTVTLHLSHDILDFLKKTNKKVKFHP